MMGRPSLTPQGALLVESGEVVNGLKNGVLAGTYRLLPYRTQLNDALIESYACDDGVLETPPVWFLERPSPSASKVSSSLNCAVAV